MDAPHLHESAESTTPLDQSISADDTPSTSFRFVDLPAEIRNIIYRYVLVHSQQPARLVGHYRKRSAKPLAIAHTNRSIYSEAMPIFHSKNAFAIIGTRKEQAWLRRMRPEGRSELRKVTLEITNDTVFGHEYRLFNALSLCSHVHLTLRVLPSRLVTAYLEDSLKNMHGFKAVTSDALPKERTICRTHEVFPPSHEEVILQREHLRHFETLLQHFLVPCIGKCRVHKGREGTHTQATIHVSYDVPCPCFFCC